MDGGGCSRRVPRQVRSTYDHACVRRDARPDPHRPPVRASADAGVGGSAARLHGGGRPGPRAPTAESRRTWSWAPIRSRGCQSLPRLRLAGLRAGTPGWTVGGTGRASPGRVALGGARLPGPLRSVA
jgi:hypothetical protein